MERRQGDPTIMTRTRIVSIALIACTLPGTAYGAAPTRLAVGDPLPRVEMLKPGTARFLRYTVTPDGHRKAIDIWTRQIKRETQAGHPIIEVHQQWDEAGSNVVVVQDSTLDAKTLRPLDHIRRVSHDDKVSVGGYRFQSDRVVGIADLAENSRKDFQLNTPEPVFNWEDDAELLQALPLGPGYSASIPFYDPGQEPPGRYVYAVTGSDVVPLPAGRIPCWIVGIDFPADHASRRFWFAKADHMLIHEETTHADGSVEVKSRLNPESSD
jgi:hypothetical protein